MVVLRLAYGGRLRKSEAGVAKEREQHAVTGADERPDASGPGTSDAVDWDQPLKTDTIFKYWLPGTAPDDHDPGQGSAETKPART